MKKYLFILFVSFSYSAVTDIDGNVYQTVQIGNQLWMAENLKVTHYSNGEAIPPMTINGSSGGANAYNNDLSNVDSYGMLYNWHAVDDDRGVCPEGWHVPTDEEFMELEIEIGMPIWEASQEDWRGNQSGVDHNIGGKLKSTTSDWFQNNQGATNESGFTALPAGTKIHNANLYTALGNSSFIWTRGEVDWSKGWYRQIYFGYTTVKRDYVNKNSGLSVRCVTYNISGCTDSNALNYSEAANINDGSCEYPDNGDYSLSFDGVDDYISGFGTSLDVSDENRLTFFAKINPNLPQNFPNGTIFTHTADDSAQNQYSVRLSPDGKLYFVTGGSIGSPGSFEDDGVTNLGTITLNESELHSIAITYDGETLKFYVNGSLGYQNIINDYFSSDYIGNFFIGKQGTNSAFYNGKVKQLAVWDRALSQEELALISNDEIIHETNLLGYWKFNSGTGDILYDHSGNQNHGTIHGASWIENIEGCIDVLACNYTEAANINDGTCDYSCHDNGDYSLYFDGINDDVKIINVEGLPQGNDPITMEVSINVRNYPEPINDYYIITVGTAFDNQMYAILNTDGQVSFAFYGDDLLVPYSLYEKDWIHITTTYDGLNRKIYMNGEIIAEDMTSTASVLGNNIYLAYPDMHGEVIRYNGLMDNIKIWDRALTSNDVLSSYLNNIDYSNNGLLALYKFNQGNEGNYPNTLIDYSGNQNHGEIDGASWIENIEGCTDELACNYNSSANTDDSSCEYNSDIWYVSEDGDDINCGSEEYPFASIQHAIDYSIDGDKVLVSAGTYYENINFNGKNVAVIGEDRETTIIDGGQNGSVVVFESGESNIAELNNFTIQNGNDNYHSTFSGQQNGGGIYIFSSSPIINSCIIKDNTADFYYGGGIYINCSDANSNINISNCLIIGNNSSGSGGAIAVEYNCYVNIESSTISDNIGGDYDGVVVSQNSEISLSNSIVWNNGNSNLWISDDSNSNISYSNLEIDWEGDGNIDTNPQFTDPENGKFTLQSTSPCIDAGDSNSPLDPDGTIADMGAYPFEQIQNTIELSEGNNLISFYAIPKNNSLNNILSSLGESADGIIGEGVAASNLNGNWIGSLSNIQPGKGYWLNMEQEGTLTVTGIPIQPDQLYELNSGNNLISYPFNMPSAIADVLPDLYEGYFSSFIGEGVAASQIQPGLWVGSLSQLQKNKAYWVRVSQPIDMNFEEPE